MSIPMGVPVVQAELGKYPTVTVEPQGKLERRSSSILNVLNARGWPQGLTKAVIESTNIFPVRFIVVDNSGSMQAADGKRLAKNGDGLKSISCTRWAELTDTCTEIANLADIARIPTHFHLLNACAHGQCFTVGDDGDTVLGQPSAGADLSAFLAAMKTSPGGTTPLTEAVGRIAQLIAPHAQTLISAGQMAAVVLATDGLPNDPSSFIRALQGLQKLPVWLVVRLCTDEQSVVDYWSDLDAQLERPLETLDDLRSEAHEVAGKNPWLTYGPALQLARTMGLREKLFDLMDEQILLPTQAKQLIERVLGCAELPEPEVDPAAFFTELERALQEAPAAFNPLSGRMGPWVDVPKLRRSLNGPATGFCTVM